PISQMQHLFVRCLCFRLLNALLVQTYFDPDEFWQGPEVAHRLVFGYGHLTWEWAVGLRTIGFPLLFTPPYQLLKVLHIDAAWLVAWSPRVVSVAIAAGTDVGVHTIAHKLFGSRAAGWSLTCQLLCWFNIYCLPRTFSNCLEALLVVWSLVLWPGLLIKQAAHTEPSGCSGAWTPSLLLAAEFGSCFEAARL
ncbi:unnamed protein product, partial [Ostreobium quekettii]